MREVTTLLERFIKEIGDPYVAELFGKIPQGKMLRSKLILQIAPTQEGAFLAAVVEMIHAASLLHDDVIDEADKRRGVASINAIYGDKTAIMLGDILYSKAFFELSSMPGPIPQIISDAVTKLSLGELLDVELSKSFNTDVDAYMEMIDKKTAALIEASAHAAAHLAGLDPKRYALYGKNLGLAFQIVDDILDITQDEATLGKPAMNDLKEGKTTLPFIYLYEALGLEDRKRLMGLFKKELTSQERAWLMDRFEKSGALQRAREHARALGEEALAQLQSQDSKLRAIMTSLIDRTY
ncbi:MAG: octaprenyl-diphosphate synthase [Epsilonproteobacteria bacterium]|nr:octaprenyl-diphosphate synthase [Campylobacterota bacterium]NPA63485.1 polyprenyl synthetase family protein [Campylobacterota bacterium]